MKTHDYDGTFIAVEGIDGAGKSSAIEMVDAWVADSCNESAIRDGRCIDREVADSCNESANRNSSKTSYKVADSDVDVVTTAEPYCDETTTQLRDAETLADEIAIFVEDRIQHIDAVIEPALQRGATVVTDRYVGSTYAYQASRLAESEDHIDRETAIDICRKVFDWAIEPDVTVYIDIPVDVALERVDGESDFEQRSRLESARDIYRSLYGRCSPDSRVVDGTKPLSVVRHTVCNTVKTKHYVTDTTQSGTSTDGSNSTYADAVRRE